MTSTGNANRVATGALSLAIAGILFVLYPAIRPFSDESSLSGAAAFGSNAWLISHIMAMIAFTLASLGLLSLYIYLQGTPLERMAFRALVVSWLGTGLTLPFYGAEAFGLYTIGQEVLRQGNPALMSMAGEVRGGVGIILFVVGLLLLALAAVLVAVITWRWVLLPKWSGPLFALGFVLYVPQFFGTQPLRVAHGVLVAAGCIWLALGLWQQRMENASKSPPKSAARQV